MKKILLTLLSAVLLLTALSGCGPKEVPAPTDTPVPTDTVPLELETVVITVKDFGQIRVELDPNAAPITVENFLGLVKDGFYDGLTFHRIISGFMIQGGCPNGNGTGGSGETIKGEFSKNGIDNPILHTRGVISMARARDMDSASSQFFIMHQDYPSLDGAYAAFGHVTEGIEVVDAICEAVQVEDRNGTVKPENQPVIESIVIVED